MLVRAFDPDSDNLLFSWTQLEPLNPAIELNSPISSEANFTAPQVENDTLFAFDLTVSDDKGGNGSDSVRVMVKNVQSSPGGVLPQLIANPALNNTNNSTIPVLNSTNNSSASASAMKSAIYYGYEHTSFSKYTLDNIIDVNYPNNGWTIETGPDTIRFFCPVTLRGNSTGIVVEASSVVQIMVSNPQLPAGYDTLPKVAQWVTDNLIKPDVDFNAGIRSITNFDSIELAGLPAYGILAQGDKKTSPTVDPPVTKYYEFTIRQGDSRLYLLEYSTSPDWIYLDYNNNGKWDANYDNDGDGISDGEPWINVYPLAKWNGRQGG